LTQPADAKLMYEVVVYQQL